MFAKFRRYQKLIWLLIIIGIIPGFVLIVSSVSDVRLWGRLLADLPGIRAFFPQETETAVYGTIAGRPIKEREFFEARREVLLSYFFRYGRWPESEEGLARTLNREAVSRLFLVQKARELGLEVSESAVGRIMTERIGNLPREQFEQKYLADVRLSWEDFDRFCRHEGLIQQLLHLAGLSGKLVNVREAEEALRKDSEQAHALLAVFWASNYLDKVSVSPEEVATYYSNRLTLYRVPEKVQVSYLCWPATNFYADADKRMAEITNLDSYLTEFYLKKGAEAFKDADGKPLPETEAKARLRADMRRELAVHQFARRKAAEFGIQLADQPEPNNLTNFHRLAASNGLPVLLTPPFDRINGLDDTNFPAAFEEAAFRLSTNQPIHFSPVVGDWAVYLLAFHRRLPPEYPPLETIRDKVTADCQLDQARDLARRDGTNFATTALIGLSQGKAFEDLCAQAQVPCVKLPPISGATTTLTNLDPRLQLGTIQSVLADLAPGRSSRFMWAQDGGWVLYLRSRSPAPEAEIKQELPRFLSNLRQMHTVDAFNKWFSKQAELAKVTPPREGTNEAPARTSAPRRPAAQPQPAPTQPAPAPSGAAAPQPSKPAAAASAPAAASAAPSQPRPAPASPAPSAAPPAGQPAAAPAASAPAAAPASK